MSSLGKDIEQLKLAWIAGGNTEWFSTLRKNELVVSYKVKHTLRICSDPTAGYLPKRSKNI